jgi:hypothetical protein
MRALDSFPRRYPAAAATLLALATGVSCVGSEGIPVGRGAGGATPAQSGSGGGGGNGGAAGVGGSGGTSGGGAGGAGNVAGSGGGAAGRGGNGGSGGQSTGVAGSTGTGAGGAGSADSTKLLPWTDGFEDPAFHTANWFTADSNGTWSVITDGTQVYQAVAADTETIAVTGNVNWIDQVVQVRVKVTSSASTSWAIDLLPRFADLRDYYQLTLSATSLALHARVDNTRTEIVTKYKIPAALTTGVWYTLKFAIKNGAGGATITASLDDVMALSTVDAAPVPHGGVGLGVTGATAEFDDLSVTLPP